MYIHMFEYDHVSTYFDIHNDLSPMVRFSHHESRQVAAILNIWRELTDPFDREDRICQTLKIEEHCRAKMISVILSYLIYILASSCLKMQWHSRTSLRLPQHTLANGSHTIHRGIFLDIPTIRLELTHQMEWTEFDIGWDLTSHKTILIAYIWHLE